MNSNENIQISETKDRRVILSTLWIFVTFNYLFADLFTMIFNPAVYQNAANRMTAGVVLGLAALVEIPIAMVFLSRVLTYRANRWANIFAGIESSAFVASTLHGGTAAPYYIFFAAIEIACTLVIVWYAWKWRPDPEG